MTAKLRQKRAVCTAGWTAEITFEKFRGCEANFLEVAPNCVACGDFHIKATSEKLGRNF